MNLHRQRKVISALNKLSQKYNGLIKKRTRPHIQTIQKRNRAHVRIMDVMLFLRDLFKTRKRQAVHFALDSMVILLCGQNFLADVREI